MRPVQLEFALHEWRIWIETGLYRAVKQSARVLLSLDRFHLDSAQQLIPFSTCRLGYPVEVKIWDLRFGVDTRLVRGYEGDPRADEDRGRRISHWGEPKKGT